MNILNNATNSILWLLKDNTYCERNLKNVAITYGVDPQRLIFSEALPLEQHLGRHLLADLFLDTYPYNAHTTASDSLWAGLPIITICGESFPSRVCASLLNSIGLNNLVTHNFSEYEKLAINLANNSLLLLNIKQELKDNISDFPLFDTTLYIENLEKAYQLAFNKLVYNQDPSNIYI